MAVRKYGKGKQHSAAAGNQKPEPAPASQHPLGSEPDPQAPQQPEPEQAAPEHYRTSLGDQLAAMRQYAQPDQLDQYIAFHFQGATPHERAWLRSLQHYFVHPAFPDLVRKAAGDVLVSGIPRESPAFLQGVAHKLFGQPANAAPTPAPPPMEPPPMPAPPPHDIKEHDDEPQPHHYAAPPSRDFAHVAVEPDSMPGRITLSPQERDHARASGVYDEIYAQQKSKMLKAKKAGIIKD